MDIMLRLREETRDEHERTESVVDVMRAIEDIDSYRALLARYYGFYCGADKAFAAGFPDNDKGQAPDYTPKAGWLAQDLSALGMNEEEIHKVPMWNTEQAFQSVGQYLGALYVIEGSMLGGQMIFKQIRKSLGLDEHSGARFFYGYGADTGKTWRNFGDIVRQMVDSENEQETQIVVNGARQMFGAFTGWLAYT